MKQNQFIEKISNFDLFLKYYGQAHDFYKYYGQLQVFQIYE